MADPVQPSFSTLARAVGGRYDPTTPRGQELLKQDILNEALRAEAQRAAKAAMEERKALQYIQQEAARPSRQEAPGVRSIFKDGRLVGYSTMPEAREAAEPAPQQKPMGTALEQGFISALKRADASKAARDAAEKAKASGKPMPQEVEETVTEKVVEKPAPAIPGDVFGTGFLPMGENNPFAGALTAPAAKPASFTTALSQAMQKSQAGQKQTAAQEAAKRMQELQASVASMTDPAQIEKAAADFANAEAQSLLNTLSDAELEAYARQAMPEGGGTVQGQGLLGTLGATAKGAGLGILDAIKNTTGGVSSFLFGGESKPSRDLLEYLVKQAALNKTMEAIGRPATGISVPRASSQQAPPMKIPIEFRGGLRNTPDQRALDSARLGIPL